MIAADNNQSYATMNNEQSNNDNNNNNQSYAKMNNNEQSNNNNNQSYAKLNNNDQSNNNNSNNSNNSNTNNNNQTTKDIIANNRRFLLAFKKSNAALTFPEKMMNLMNYATAANAAINNNRRGDNYEQFCVSWLPDGRAFVVYDIKEFTSKVIPKFFKASKFCSFTRKLYRWGFRQLNKGVGHDEPTIFGNEFFQQYNADLMIHMRSRTAASIRNRESNLLRDMLHLRNRNRTSQSQSQPGMVEQQQQQKTHLQNDHKAAHASVAAEAAVITARAGIPPGMSASQCFGDATTGLGGLRGGGERGREGDGTGHMNNQQLQQLYRNCCSNHISLSDMGYNRPQELTTNFNLPTSLSNTNHDMFNINRLNSLINVGNVNNHNHNHNHSQFNASLSLLNNPNNNPNNMLSGFNSQFNNHDSNSIKSAVDDLINNDNSYNYNQYHHTSSNSNGNSNININSMNHRQQHY